MKLIALMIVFPPPLRLSATYASERVYMWERVTGYKQINITAIAEKKIVKKNTFKSLNITSVCYFGASGPC